LDTVSKDAFDQSCGYGKIFYIWKKRVIKFLLYGLVVEYGYNSTKDIMLNMKILSYTTLKNTLNFEAFAAKAFANICQEQNLGVEFVTSISLFVENVMVTSKCLLPSSTAIQR